MPHVRERGRRSSSYGYDYLDEAINDEELYSTYIDEMESGQRFDDDMDEDNNYSF